MPTPARLPAVQRRSWTSRASSPSGRAPSTTPGRLSAAWLKFKLNCSQEFVIGGYTAESVRCADHRLLRWRATLCFQGAHWLQPVTAPRAAPALDYACNEPLPVCESAESQARTVGLRSNEGRDGTVPMAQASPRRADRVHRVDAGWAFKAFK